MSARRRRRGPTSIRHSGAAFASWAALRGGADWEEIGAALGVTPAQAWDTFQELLAGGDAATVASARQLAGTRPA